MRRLLAVCCAGSLAALLGPVAAARAQEDPRVAEIRAAAAAYIDAINRGDDAAIAAHWTADGLYVDAAGNATAAASLAPAVPDAAAPAAAGKDAPPARDPAPRQLVDSAIHFVAPTVAIEHGRAAPPPGADAPPLDFVAAWVNEDGQWRLSLLREFTSAAATDPAPPKENPLAELAWLVGRWTAENGGAEIEMTAEMTPGQAYLVERFVARRPGGADRSGEQRIAWDAAAGQMRSWTFNADGSFAEARWHKEGDVWVAEAVGELADGRPTRSVHFWTPDGADVCWFKSLNGEIDGQPADDLILKFTRSGAASP